MERGLSMYPFAVVDLHCDTLTAFTAPGRCQNTLDDPCASLSLSCLPRGIRWCQCFAIFIPDGLSPAESAGYYRRHQQSFMRQMELFAPRVAPCRTAADIETAWAAGKTAALLTVENGAALAGDLDRVEVLARDGVRMMTLTWNGENEIGSGLVSDLGLTSFGKSLIPHMEAAGILVDVSHLNDRGLADLLEVAKKPFVASHSNARRVCSHKRNLTDSQIRELAARHCLIGLNYYVEFLREDGHPTPDDLFAHVDHFLALGAEDCLALGSDFDGADLPFWLDSPEKAAGLYGCFLERGYSPALCDKIFFGNALAFFRENLH